MSDHTETVVVGEPQPAIVSLTYKRILQFCALVFLLTMGGVATAFSNLPLPLRIAIPLACLAAVATFAWLFFRRNPEGATRRRAALALIFGGSFLLAQIPLAFRNFHLQIGEFVVSFGLNTGGHWSIDALLILAAVAMIGGGVWLLKLTAAPVTVKVARESGQDDNIDARHTIEDEPSYEQEEVQPLVFWEQVRQLFHARSFGGYDLTEVNEEGCCVGT